MPASRRVAALCAFVLLLPSTLVDCKSLLHSSSEVLAYRNGFKSRTGPKFSLDPAFGDVLDSAGAPGPCAGGFITIPVFTEDDVSRRTSLPPSTPVLLFLQRRISLTRGLVLDHRYSCTRIISSSSSAASLAYWGADMPAVTITNTSNVWLDSIRIRHGATNHSAPCNFGLFEAGKVSDTVVCPGIYVVDSFGVQITRAVIVGRIDIFRSVAVLLDHVKATVYPYTYDPGHPYDDYRTHGVINIGQVTAGTSINASLSHIIVSNSEVFGAWELISLFQGAVGVTVANNFLHSFAFAAIRCGDGSGYVMDCHHNVIEANFIYNRPDDVRSTDANSAGVYMCTRWFNPGNILSCNFILNQRICYRLAAQSSGVSIEGGICHNATNAVRMDNGKFNSVVNLTVTGTTGFPSPITCSSLYKVNCFSGQGNNWEALRRAYYSTNEMHELYPYMSEICDPVRASFSNVQCNPPSQTQATVSQTGYCSGLPYGNKVQLLMDKLPPANLHGFPGCKNVTADLSLLNTQDLVNVSSSPQLPDTISLGRLQMPLFFSDESSSTCPSSSVGPLPVDGSYYRGYFNIREPPFFARVTAFDVSRLANSSLAVPPSDIEVVN